MVVFLMRQERADVDMSLRLPLFRRLRIVDESYKPVPVVPNIKDDVALYRIGILDFVRCIWVGFHRLPQVLTRNDVHLPRILHNM